MGGYPGNGSVICSTAYGGGSARHGQGACNTGGGGGGFGGGGSSTAYGGGGGGGLGYKNNISVTSGTGYTVVVGAGGSCFGPSFHVGGGGGGAVRIVWPGNNRQFPSTCVGTP